VFERREKGKEFLGTSHVKRTPPAITGEGGKERAKVLPKGVEGVSLNLRGGK